MCLCVLSFLRSFPLKTPLCHDPQPAQIPSGRKPVLDAYGEIIFRAWKEASGPCLLEVESTCIQVGGGSEGGALTQSRASALLCPSSAAPLSKLPHLFLMLVACRL